MKIRPARRRASLLGGVLALAGCAAPAPPLSQGHLTAAQAASSAVSPVVAPIPEIASGVPVLPEPTQIVAPETYSVVVSNVSVQTLLFAIARDAKLNLDIHPGITGTVTLNALDQTMPEILDRVARQVDMRYELSGNNLYVLPDSPFLRLYKVDYPNISRDSESTTASQSQVATTGQSGSGNAGNVSGAQVRNTSNNRFWSTLTENIRDLLRETDKVIPAGSNAAPVVGSAVAPTVPSTLTVTPSSPAARSGTQTVSATAAPIAPVMPSQPTQFREAASVIANPETGIMSVRATGRQHQRVREFLDQVLRSSRRQVLIEATIVEVGLTNDYQQGINWSLVRNAVNGSTDISLVQAPGGGSAISSGSNQPFLGALSFLRRGSNFDLSATVKLLESFGRTRVLSSPKISVMNNQSALLKVVDNKIYFTVDVTPGTPATATSAATPAVYTTQVNTVPVGFLMNVTAQIGEDDGITLNLRPTVSRITGYAVDPNPALAAQGVTNRIPEIQTREFESIMKVRDGEVAVLGGLMQDDQSNATDQIPVAGEIPVLGELFRYRNNRATKNELVVFLRPTILRDNSLDGDLSFIRRQLPPGVSVPAVRP
ncbi:MAG: pilus (MSHA type) biogenesis protein MshL [Ramlibacter sp.]|nr:pilus (MSHA type) biogenesis protein MshL [Ramlibacter sp.]